MPEASPKLSRLLKDSSPESVPSTVAAPPTPLTPPMPLTPPTPIEAAGAAPAVDASLVVDSWPSVPPTSPAPHVSMPLGDYVVRPIPDVSMPADLDTTVSPEHIACKQPAKPMQSALF